MESEPRTAKHYNCHYCCICMNYRGKVMEDRDGKKEKCLCIVSRLSCQKIARVWKEKKAFWGSL